MASLAIAVFIASCGTENESAPTSDATIEDEAITQDTLSESDTTNVTEVTTYNMFPEVIYPDLSEEEFVDYGTLMVFQGKVNSSKHSLFLIPNDYYDDRCKGLLYDHANNKAVYLESAFYSSDSINLSSQSTPEQSISLNGAFSDGNDLLKGEWINTSDTLTFELTQQKATPQERQLMVELWGFEFQNSPEELVCVYPQGYVFNDFHVLFEEGSGYDFGQEWWEDNRSLHIYDSTFLFISCTTNNTEYTNFVEGKEPNGIEDTDYEVESIGYHAYIDCSFEYLQDGQIQEDSFEKNYDFNVETWIIDDILIIMKDPADGPLEFLESYQFNSQTHLFELL